MAQRTLRVAWHAALCAQLLYPLAAAPLHAQVGRPAAESSRPGASPRSDGKHHVYAYTDDRGQLVRVSSLAQVPLSLRGHARPVEAPLDLADDPADAANVVWSFADLDRTASADAFYRYRTTDGRTVYTNLFEQVPEEQRPTAKLDFSHAPFDGELVQQLDARLKVEHDKLLASACCQELRREAKKPVAKRIVQDESPLLVCGAALLLFIGLTPWMSGKVGGGPWARTLSMATSSLVLAGILMFATMRATRAVHELVARAAPCQPEAWNAVVAASHTRVALADAGQSASPELANELGPEVSPELTRDLQQHLQLMKQLQEQVRQYQPRPAPAK
ncbi:MAG TPA: hypothetical protein VF331_27640 [Polyangiales bacterium]